MTPGIYTYNIATQQVNLFLDTDASFGIAVIPEPGTYALLVGLAMGALLIVRRRFRK